MKRGVICLLVKTKIKEYPDGTKIAYVYSSEFIKTNGSEESVLSSGNGVVSDPDELEHIQRRNLQKTKTRIRDYVLSNDFKYFITLTFADDRNDDTRCFKKLENWLKYQKKKYGKFSYIFIPERHKDGCLHFHGVLGEFTGVIEYSGVKHKGAEVFNLSEWNYGYSTATLIQSKKKTASYVTKYITKNLSHDIVPKGKKKYWSSRGLTLPVETYYSDIPFSAKNEVWSNESVKIFDL